MDGLRNEEEAHGAISAAARQAAAAGKRVLVVFRAEWCGDSAALERAFAHPLIAPLATAAFEIVWLDVGARERHAERAAEWGIDFARGIPAVAVLEPSGEVVSATTEGELATARAQSPMELAALLHRWIPEALRG